MLNALNIDRNLNFKRQVKTGDAYFYRVAFLGETQGHSAIGPIKRGDCIFSQNTLQSIAVYLFRRCSKCVKVIVMLSQYVSQVRFVSPNINVSLTPDKIKMVETLDIHIHKPSR